MLIKLAKLANHNPNEHEANLAARKVCQMLSEDNYTALDKLLKNHQPRQQQRQQYQGAGTWNDIHRTTEEEFQNGPFSPKNRNWGRYDPFNDPHYGKSTEFDWKEFFKSKWTWTPYPGPEPENYKGYKKVYAQKFKNCTVCGIDKFTVDEDNPFVCFECKRGR